MTLNAGEILTAGRAMRLQSKEYDAQASALLDSTSTTEADIPGATYTLTTETAGAAYRVVAFFDCEARATSASVVMVGKLMIDGVIAPGTSTHDMTDLGRDTVGMTWRGTLASAGAHTFKLRGNLSGSLATGGRFQPTNTRFTVQITEVV